MQGQKQFTDKGVLVTTGRKITLSRNALFIKALHLRIVKPSFCEAINYYVGSGLGYSTMCLLLASHESMNHLREAW